MHSSVVDVSPDLAQQWLKANTFNRKISTHTVSRYARDMAAGAWKLNHQGIGFDNQGTLVDGQHRLYAIIKSGVTIKMLVTWGGDKIGIDELRVRATADIVKFGGLSDWIEKRHLETAKQMIALCSNNASQGVYSTNDLVSFANNNRRVIEFSNKLFSTNAKGISSAASRAVIATAAYHFSEDDLAEFVSALYSGVITHPDRSAAIRCRDMMLQGAFNGGSVQRRGAAYKTMRAVKAFCDRQPLRALIAPNKPTFLVPEDRA